MSAIEDLDQHTGARDLRQVEEVDDDDLDGARGIIVAVLLAALGWGGFFAWAFL